MGQQQVGAQRAQGRAQAAVQAGRAAGEVDRGKGDVEVRVEALAAGEIAVHGDDRVSPSGAEPVGDGREADLLPADAEAGEHR